MREVLLSPETRPLEEIEEVTALELNEETMLLLEDNDLFTPEFIAFVEHERIKRSRKYSTRKRW